MACHNNNNNNNDNNNNNNNDNNNNNNDKYNLLIYSVLFNIPSDQKHTIGDTTSQVKQKHPQGAYGYCW